ncbi:MAG TPA: phenylalanine--tRNA ligase subunit beta, partial [Candidatus Eremiobacteraceae bacterium]|nr:phenylalanine--tRNA ligase subunit beta [Candidatus Eremiobacteraceae bacterium]
MRAPISWLRDFVQTDAAPQAFAEALTARGFTVDDIAEQPMPAHVVVGRVETLERHPNADRLLVGLVDVGRERLQIVTGATNVTAGDKVPIALVGATVYSRATKDGAAASSTKRIERSTLRGVESAGMMCSPDELALPGEYPDGILIMDEESRVGDDFWHAARFGDAVLDVDVPSNRPDGLAIIGLAREAAAGLRAPLRVPELPPSTGDAPSPIAIAIEDVGVCRRLLGQHFASVTYRRTPLWMVLRLQAAGMRSINWFVDVSNYVQIETGQPLHFYDADKLRGARIVARAATAGESVTTLDGVKRELPAGTPVMADGAGPVGIAGIMGGAESGVTEQTRNIFLESPNFVGARIRRASIALGLRTEGALRHEKDLPLELPEIGRRRAAQLLAQSNGTASQVVEAGSKPGPPHTVSVRPERVNAVLAASFSVSQMREALTAIEIAVSGESPLQAVVPYWRRDIIEEVDLIEEVARGIGFAGIPEVSVIAAPQAIPQGQYDQETLLSAHFAALGYREIVSISLQGSRTLAAWERSGVPFWEDIVPIVNPLSDDYRFLRPSLLPG